MTSQTIYLATIWIIPVLVAITFHEAAHGLAAHLLGDDTAWRLGRVSFNPLKHVDPVGTILLPGILLLVRSPFLFGPNPYQSIFGRCAAHVVTWCWSPPLGLQ
jgi:Zn-dependent protease